MTYKPSEHCGLKENGEPDKRTSSSHGFPNDPECASELGKQGGKTQAEEVYKPSEHGGVKKDVTQDSRTSSEHGFGGDRERAAERGAKGGKQ